MKKKGSGSKKGYASLVEIPVAGAPCDKMGKKKIKK